MGVISVWEVVKPTDDMCHTTPFQPALSWLGTVS